MALCPCFYPSNGDKAGDRMAADRTVCLMGNLCPIYVGAHMHYGIFRALFFLICLYFEYLCVFTREWLLRWGGLHTHFWSRLQHCEKGQHRKGRIVC